MKNKFVIVCLIIVQPYTIQMYFPRIFKVSINIPAPPRQNTKQERQPKAKHEHHNNQSNHFQKSHFFIFSILYFFSYNTTLQSKFNVRWQTSRIPCHKKPDVPPLSLNTSTARSRSRKKRVSGLMSAFRRFITFSETFRLLS